MHISLPQQLRGVLIARQGGAYQGAAGDATAAECREGMWEELKARVLLTVIEGAQRAAVIDAINRGMEDKQSVYWKGSDPESEFCANVRYAGDDIYAEAAD